MKSGASDYQTKEYWDKLLQDYDLSMEKGRNRNLHYVGGENVLARIEGEQSTKNGRTRPKKRSE